MASADPTQADALRVLQIIPVLKIGGLERVATSLSIELHRRGHRVVVCSMGGEPFESILAAAGVTVDIVPRPRANLERMITSPWGIAKTIRREQPDVIHAHNPVAALAAAVARLWAGRPRLPIVTTYHGVMPDRIGNAARAMESVSAAVVGVGPTSTDALLRSGLRADKAHTIRNAVNAVASRSREAVRAEFGLEDAELVVTIGRYAPEKNQALLLGAVADLAAHRPHLRALVVGSGDPEFEAELAADLVRLGAEGVATITGERSDAVDITGAADVFCLSSDSEGLPLALLEALALGTPVVTTDAGGVRDAVVDGETGLLVRIGDRKALAAAIDRLLGDAELRARLVRNGRELVDRTCSPAAMADAYEHLYSDVLERARPAARRTGASPST